MLRIYPFQNVTDHLTLAAPDVWAPFFDSLGICRLPNREFPDILTGLINAATGWDFTVDEGVDAGFRTINLLRAFNIRHGHTPDREAPSARYGSSPVDGPFRGIDVSHVWKDMINAYYKHMGWDSETGKPLPETLGRLGLDYVISELWPEYDPADV